VCFVGVLEASRVCWFQTFLYYQQHSWIKPQFPWAYFSSLCDKLFLSPFSGNALQKHPVSLIFQMSWALYPSNILGNHSFHDSTILPDTSPNSPRITNVMFGFPLFQPSDPLKSVMLRCSAISLAFSISDHQNKYSYVPRLSFIYTVHHSPLKKEIFYFSEQNDMHYQMHYFHIAE